MQRLPAMFMHRGGRPIDMPMHDAEMTEDQRSACGILLGVVVGALAWAALAFCALWL